MKKAPCGTMCVRVPGFEPGTSPLSEVRSNQLSYTRLLKIMITKKSFDSKLKKRLALF